MLCSRNPVEIKVLLIFLEGLRIAGTLSDGTHTHLV